MYLSIIFSLIISFVAPAYAHEHHDSLPAHRSIEQLEHFLEEERATAVEHELFSLAREREQRGGELLLAAVYEELVATQIAQGKPGVKRASTEALLAVIKKFNPVALGRWVISVGREHGAGLAIPYGMSEVAEQIGILMTAKYPELAFLLPVYLTHMSDVVVFGAYFGLPKIARAMRVWKNQGGGFFSGPHLYYEHLSKQRRFAPIDWSVVIDVAESAESEIARFAVIDESRIGRALPRRLQIVFTPRKLAQKEALTTLGLWEIERLARESLIPLWPFKHLKHHRQMYTRLLLAEIADNAMARAKLSELLRRRFNLTEKKSVVAAQSVDVAAEKWLWHLRNRRDQLKERLKAQAMGMLSGQRRLFRRLSRLLDHRGPLLKIATTAASRAAKEQWQDLDQAVRQIDVLFRELETTLPDVSNHCEKLLLSNETVR